MPKNCAVWDRRRTIAERFFGTSTRSILALDRCERCQVGRPRHIFVPGLSVHVIQRGNNHASIFARDTDRQMFLELTRRAIARYAVAAHAFVLMDTHVHLLVTPETETSLPRAMQQLGSTYVKYFNRTYERIGTLWNGRYRRIPVEDERYWLTCLRYIEQNPVRARIVSRPEDYRWSSFDAHAWGRWPDWLTPHPLYKALGQTDGERQAAYRALCNVAIADRDLVPVRHAFSALRCQRSVRVVSETSPTLE